MVILNMPAKKPEPIKETPKRISKTCLNQSEKKVIKPTIFLPLALALVGFLILLPDFVTASVWTSMLTWTVTLWTLFIVWIICILGIVMGIIFMIPYFSKDCD